MRRTASEVLRRLENRVARLENRQSNRVITSSLSNDSKSVLIALSNHTRKTPIAKKGNFNILQEVLESLGFNYEFKEAQVQGWNVNGFETVEEDLERVNEGGGYTSIHVPISTHPTEREAFQKYNGELKRIEKALPYIDFVNKKPKSTPFGRVSIILAKETWQFPQGNPTKWFFGFGDNYVGIRRVNISKNGKKVTLTISPYGLDFENYDLTKIINFAIKLGAVEDAKSLLISLEGSPIEDEEPQLTLLEQGKGTCCFCNSIQRTRNDGKLFKHGYRIQGWRMSKECYGSFEYPIEVSSEGMKNVKKRLNDDIKYYKKMIKEFKTELRSTPRGAERLEIENKIGMKERSIKGSKDLITQLDQKIKSWKPQS